MNMLGCYSHLSVCTTKEASWVSSSDFWLSELGLSFHCALSVTLKVVRLTHYWNARCFRLLSGHTCFVLSVFLSTSHWMPLMGSRPDAPIAVLHWVSCLTTAVTPSPQVSLLVVDIIYTVSVWISSYFLKHCLCTFFSVVFVVLGTTIAVQMGTNPDWMFFCCFAGMFMFYCAHWQTYVSGTLRFGM